MAGHTPAGGRLSRILGKKKWTVQMVSNVSVRSLFPGCLIFIEVKEEEASVAFV